MDDATPRSLKLFRNEAKIYPAYERESAQRWSGDVATVSTNQESVSAVNQEDSACFYRIK